MDITHALELAHRSMKVIACKRPHGPVPCVVIYETINTLWPIEHTMGYLA
jgi:hypothetical protein